MIEYIKTTNDDLRGHSFRDYGEVIDCWQWMLEISTHAERHINQIRSRTTRIFRRDEGGLVAPSNRVMIFRPSSTE